MAHDKNYIKLLNSFTHSESELRNGGILAFGRLVGGLGCVPGMGESLGLERGQNGRLVLVHEDSGVAGKDEERDVGLVGNQGVLVAGRGAGRVIAGCLGSEAENPVCQSRMWCI